MKKKTSIILYCVITLLLIVPIVFWINYIISAITAFSKMDKSVFDAMSGYLSSVFAGEGDSLYPTEIMAQGIIRNLFFIFIQCCAIALITFVFVVIWKKNFIPSDEERREKERRIAERRQKQIERLNAKIDKLK